MNNQNIKIKQETNEYTQRNTHTHINTNIYKSNGYVSLLHVFRAPRALNLGEENKLKDIGEMLRAPERQYGYNIVLCVCPHTLLYL